MPNDRQSSVTTATALGRWREVVLCAATLWAGGCQVFDRNLLDDNELSLVAKEHSEAVPAEPLAAELRPVAAAAEGAEVASTPPIASDIPAAPSADAAEIPDDPPGDPAPLTLREAVVRTLAGSDAVAVARFTPAEVRTGIDAELAAFDPVLGASGQYRDANNQVGSVLQSYGGGINRVNTATAGAADGYGDNLSVSKRWGLGTRTRLGYTTGFQQTDPAGSLLLVNPAWQSSLGLTVEQPLLRGVGWRQNELPLLIARTRHDGAAHQADAAVVEVIRQVHESYWTLYLAQSEADDLTALATEAERTAAKEQRRLALGDGSAAEAAQARETLGQLRVERIEAARRAAAASESLRRLLALPAGGETLRVADRPPTSGLQPDMTEGVTTALASRPELRTQRAAVKAARLEVERQEMGLKPNVTAFTGYSLTGLNGGFGASSTDLAGGQFGNWSLGVGYRSSLGLRAEKAAAERARLAAAREQATLRGLERAVEHEGAAAASDLGFADELVTQAAERFDAATVQFRATEALYEAGQADLDRFVRARRGYAVAAAAAREAAVRQTAAVTAWYAATGTLVGAAAESSGVEPPPAPAVEAEAKRQE